MSRLPLVLAIEPDLRQAAIVKRVVKERVQAEIVVVDSRDAAIAAIGTAMPDVLLVSALLSPRDEDDLMAHLRTLEGATHLQTHTIPQLASTLGHDNGGGGLFSAFRRRKADSVAAGCDPDLFADEIRMYVKRSEERKQEAALAGPIALPTRGNRPAETPAAGSAPEESAPVQGSSWSSPFEWRPSNHTSYISSAAPPIESPAPPMPEPSIATPEPAIVLPESGDLGAGGGYQEPEYRDLAPESGDLGSGIEDLRAGGRYQEPEYRDLAPESGDLESGNGDLGSGVGDLGPGVGELESEIGRYDQDSAGGDSLPPVPAVWARHRPSITELEDAPPTGEVHDLLAGLGVPNEVASVAYANGCRIRRVRVPVAREQHGPLHGAVVLSRRMLAELRGTDAGA